MGVNSLWEILGPTARPVRLEALSRKKLAVDASIWIYQFLKAVRDQDGNSLPQSHIVGFFRRICKLLYFGILPIFVFDGGAPILKRETINKRKSRRLGNSETKRQTAHKLLAIQALRQGDGKNILKKPATKDNNGQYYEDTLNNQKSNDNTLSSFVKKDDYHLPDLKEFKVTKDDGRIIPEDENFVYEDFDIVDGIDINTCDTKSPEFQQLPKSTQYMILSHLRIKSRLRLGYQKEQLQELFPNPNDFSKFQIQLVQKRNYYTQKLMDISGMNSDGTTTARRIAGDKDRAYALMKNDDGWTLSLSSNSAENPITLDDDGNELNQQNEISKSQVHKQDINSILEPPQNQNQIQEIVKVESEDDSDFENVPLTDSKQSQEEKDIQRRIIDTLYREFDKKDKPEIHSVDLTFNDPKEQQPVMKETDDEFSFSNSILFNGVKTLNVAESKGILNSEEKESKNSPTSLNEAVVMPRLQNNFESNPVSEKQFTSVDPSEFTENRNPTFEMNEPLQSKVIDKEKLKSKNLNQDIALPEHKKQKTPECEVSNNEQEAYNKVNSSKLEDMGNSEDEPTTEKKKPLNLMPLWFDDSVQSTQFTQPNPFSFQNVEHSIEEEDTGLIPWDEAKDMLDNEEKDISSNQDDVQEISEMQMSDQLKIGEQQVQEENSTSAFNVSKDGKARVAKYIDFDFEEKEEEEWVRKLEVEEEDHKKFTNQIKENYDEVLARISESINEEHLLQEKLLKAKRDSDEVDQNMILDVQELLRRFGIPYITAPMEAEAQCAELMKLGLVDGIITDDSDCFLFGGDAIYKNMFNQKQFVECYHAKEIESQLGLSQDRLIDLALLLGSDYTEGVKGIGPVMGVEILAEFGNLKNFKKWYNEQILHPNKDCEYTKLQKTLLNRIKSGKLSLTESFPEKVVVDAYIHPEVDSDNSVFKWGMPSLDEIRSFLMYNVKWTQERVDEVMVPLIRDMNKKRAEGTQSTIGEFFPQEYIQSKKELNLGKRLKTATNKLNKKRRKS